MMNILKLVIIAVISAAAIAACTQPNTPNLTTTNTATVNATNTNAGANATSPRPSPADEAAAGREIYSQNCVACHKEDGTGGKVTIEGKTINPDNLTTDRKKSTPDEKFREWIANGVPDEGMPAFKDKLSDEQITQVIAFIRKDLQGK
jgi:mono/diheme cytochrome c family protein